MTDSAKDVNNFYDVYDSFDGDIEAVINAIGVFMKKSKKKVDRGQIRTNLENLYLRPYRKFLNNLTALPKSELVKYRVAEYAKIDFVILQLNTLILNGCSLKRSKLIELRMLVNQLLEISK